MSLLQQQQRDVDAFYVLSSRNLVCWDYSGFVKPSLLDCSSVSQPGYLKAFHLCLVVSTPSRCIEGPPPLLPGVLVI